jgi:hypothetical protein
LPFGCGGRSGTACALWLFSATLFGETGFGLGLMLLSLGDPSVVSSDDEDAICAHPQLTDTTAAKARAQPIERNPFRIKSPPLGTKPISDHDLGLKIQELKINDRFPSVIWMLLPDRW